MAGSLAEVKIEMMQVGEVPGQDSLGVAEANISGWLGDKAEERGSGYLLKEASSPVLRSCSMGKRRVLNSCHP